jgi:hypothetical protein
MSAPDTLDAVDWQQSKVTLNQEDPAFGPMQLVCTKCDDEVICEVDHEDTLLVLMTMVMDHNEKAHPW